MAESTAVTEGERAALGDVCGAVADLGVLVPLGAALIVVNHLDASAVFVGAGLMVLAAGAFFRIPFPVQPLKALTAVAVAQQLAPDVIHAAGLEIAAFLLLLSVGRVADVIFRAFTKPVVRALQLGVGLLLLLTASKLVLHAPAVFRGTPPAPWPVVGAVASFGLLVHVARSGRYAVVLGLLATGVVAAMIVAPPLASGPSPAFPKIGFPSVGAFAPAFVLLVVPQLPLTFGNAVVAVTDVAREYFGPDARRVTPARVCLSAGIGNAVSGVIGGMPMCHGAGGLTAHVRFGARTVWMNVMLGMAFIVLGLFFASRVTAVLGLLPVWVLAAFLAYAGLSHGLLLSDLGGVELFLALCAGILGAVLRNLAVTVVVALAVDHGRRLLRGRRVLGARPGA